MKKRKRSIEKAIVLTKIRTFVRFTATYLREKGAIYQQKDPFHRIASSRCMSEVTCSQELSSLSMNNGSLKILGS
ncbi:hypothetical protein AYI68_g7605 [Smittium mucronatum]|uniref:Uncharacterized protein n=1 Tax=Smittium mucronatum TaxID=133383 RepID=A0A1R0GN74_9FUNG|nr:hypothetical protein AYI68_g7605 [Smittium mucronatum]